MYRHDDYKCISCEHEFEEMTNGSTDVPCARCGDKTIRLLGAPSIDWRRMGLDPSFPSSYSKWGVEQTRKNRTDKGSLNGDRAPNLKMY